MMTAPQRAASAAKTPAVRPIFQSRGGNFHMVARRQRDGDAGEDDGDAEDFREV